VKESNIYGTEGGDLFDRLQSFLPEFASDHLKTCIAQKKRVSVYYMDPSKSGQPKILSELWSSVVACQQYTMEEELMSALIEKSLAPLSGKVDLYSFFCYQTCITLYGNLFCMVSSFSASGKKNPVTITRFADEDHGSEEHIVHVFSDQNDDFRIMLNQRVKHVELLSTKAEMLRKRTIAVVDSSIDVEEILGETNCEYFDFRRPKNSFARGVEIMFDNMRNESSGVDEVSAAVVEVSSVSVRKRRADKGTEDVQSAKKSRKGERVAKDFPAPHGICFGTVDSVNESAEGETFYRIKYDDGDSEDMSKDELDMATCTANLFARKKKG